MFLSVSLAIGVVVLIFRMYDKLWEAPGLPNVNWVSSLVTTAVLGAGMLWVVSKVNPEAWDAIKSMVGLKDKGDGD